jgi:hypothetical protein
VVDPVVDRRGQPQLRPAFTQLREAGDLERTVHRNDQAVALWEDVERAQLRELEGSRSPV